MFGHNGRVSLSTIVIKYYVLSNITRLPGTGLEKNQNFTSSWDVIRRYLLDLIIFLTIRSMIQRLTFENKIRSL